MSFWSSCGARPDRRRKPLHRLVPAHDGPDARECSRRLSAPTASMRSTRCRPISSRCANMAAGHIADAMPLYEDLVARVPEMSFPISSLLRAHAFQRTGRRGPAARARRKAPAAGVPGHGALRSREARSHAGAHRRLARRFRGAHRQDRMAWTSRAWFTPRISASLTTPTAQPSARQPGARRRSRRHHGPGRLPHGAAVPGQHAGASQRPALSAPVRAAGPRRILDWRRDKWPDCAARDALRLQARVQKAQDVPKEDFGF